MAFTVKKTVLFVLLLVFPVMLCAGCAEKQATEQYAPYEALLCDVSDSAAGGSAEAGYTFADKEKQDNIRPKRSLVFTLRGAKTNVGLVSSAPEYRAGNYFPEYTYKDSEGNEYMADGNGLLTYYSNTHIPAESGAGPISTKEGEAIAESFVGGIFDTAEYKRTAVLEEKNGRKRYKISYTKYLDGLETADRAEIAIRLDGEVDFYSGFMLNRIPSETDVSGIDLSAAKRSVKQKLDERYENVKARYDRIEYDEPAFQLTVLKNGQKALFTYLGVDCINVEENGLESRLGELLKIVIPLP